MIETIIINEHDAWILHQQLEAAAKLGIRLDELADEPDWDVLDEQGME